jgi:carboxylesterase type B
MDLDLGTDMIFTCAIRNTTDNAVLHMGPSVPVYNYIFNHTMTFDAWGPHYNYCIGHSCHGAELPYLFVRRVEASLSC